MKTLNSLQNIDFETKIGDKTTNLILLKNSRGMEVTLSDYGARIISVIVPDRSGRPLDVVLGFNSIEKYITSIEPYYGATIGRFANRIARGEFQIDNQAFQIAPNNGENALHGGYRGFHSKVWDRRMYPPSEIQFFYVSADDEEGFPGTLSVTVAYLLTEENELIVRYFAKTDKPTIVNFTNHAFFNLNGEGDVTIRNHLLKINADSFLPTDHRQIPTGRVRHVEGTPFDFRDSRVIGDVICCDEEQLRIPNGFDHNYVLNRNNRHVDPAADLLSPQTGIRLQIYTTEPGLQLYTGNALTGKDVGKRGMPYPMHSAICLETQNFPNAPNEAGFPNCILRPGEQFRSESRYRFSVMKTAY